MTVYRYKTYSDIPATTIQYISMVAGVNCVTELTIGEINDFMNDLKHWHNNYSDVKVIDA